MEIGQRVVKETGGHFIAPFNDVRVIAGQGTATLEFFEQTENKLEVIVTPLGGGGLLSGILFYFLWCSFSFSFS